MKNIKQSNTKIIRAIHEKLTLVSIKKVAAKLGRTHNSLYFHLNEKRAASANIEVLQQITAAIKAVEIEEAKASKKILQSLNS